MNLEERIRVAWAKYPEAKVIIKEVTSTPKRTQAPKDTVRIFVRRGKRSDSIYVLKGGTSVSSTLNPGVRLNDLTDEELHLIGALPYEDCDHHCTSCGEFTARIFVNPVDSSGLCVDCIKLVEQPDVV